MRRYRNNNGLVIINAKLSEIIDALVIITDWSS